MVEITRYSDTEGAWLRVSHHDLYRYGFLDEIRSPSTRMSLSWVYLYGDDGVRYIERVKAHGDEPVVEDNPPAERSTIRRMSPYRKEMVFFAPVPGRLLRFDGHLWRVEQEVSPRRSGRITLRQID